MSVKHLLVKASPQIFKGRDVRVRKEISYLVHMYVDKLSVVGFHIYQNKIIGKEAFWHYQFVCF